MATPEAGNFTEGNEVNEGMLPGAYHTKKSGLTTEDTEITELGGQQIRGPTDSRQALVPTM